MACVSSRKRSHIVFPVSRSTAQRRKVMELMVGKGFHNVIVGHGVHNAIVGHRVQNDIVGHRLQDAIVGHGFRMPL
jgi:hypothetical protein